MDVRGLDQLENFGSRLGGLGRACLSSSWRYLRSSTVRKPFRIAHAVLPICFRTAVAECLIYQWFAKAWLQRMDKFIRFSESSMYAKTLQSE